MTVWDRRKVMERGMMTFRRRTTVTLSALVLCAATLLAQTATVPNAAPNWQTTFQQRLSVYGHRNWIIVADAAFPAYSGSGIETIVVNEDMPSVLKYVLGAIRASKHVRATAFLDQELQFVREEDYPGVTHLRKDITAALGESGTSSTPHSEVLSKIDDAGKTFRILFIKTNATIPYTSVYMRLDCGYMSDEIEQNIKNAVSQVKK
jgi:hypothetical protein